MGFKGVGRLCLRLGIVAVLWAGQSGVSAAQSAQDRRLVETSVFEAGFDVTSLAFSSDEASLYIAGGGEASKIVRLDLGGIEQVSQPLDGMISDIVVGPSNLFLIGTTPDETWIETRDPGSLALLGRQTLPRIGEPKAHLGNSGKLFVGGYTPGSRDNATLFAVDGTRPGLPVLKDEERNLLFNGAIGRIWVSEEEGRIFINDAETARLWSITTEGQVETSIGHNTQNRQEAIPLSVAVTVKNDPRCSEVLRLLPNQPSRFVIADYLLGSVNNAVFSRAFGVFDIVSETASRLKNLAGAELATYDGTGLTRPPMLISASCDQSTILIASRYSDQVVQYAHQIGSNAFELVNKWSVRSGSSVRAVATSLQGNWGAMSLSDTGAVVLFDRGGDVEKEDTSESEMINRAIQRHLLLVGYRIGAIDGILGGKTSAAMEAFAQKHGLKAGVSEPQEFLPEMLQVIESKGLE